MQHPLQAKLLTLIFWGLSFSLFMGCRSNTDPATLAQTGRPETTASPTMPIPIPEPSSIPSPTAIPLAARVDGIEITLPEYQAELEMYLEAKGADLAPEDKKVVLDDLLNRALLASAAGEKGFLINDTLLEERIEQISAEMEAGLSLSDWVISYYYGEETFYRALRLSIASSWMRDQIIQEVPRYAEQVHARQIIVYDSPTANDIYQQLQAGNSFRNLALKYDPITGGDLGWFPRGYLPYPAVEDAAFSLEPEQYSSVIETPAGFHILQLLERDSQRELSPDALLVLQSQALQDWLTETRENNQIEVFVAEE